MAEFLNYPFDPELFSYNWQNEKDPVLTAIVESGAVVESAEINRLISAGSDYYTLPVYKPLTGNPVNYDGQTDILINEPEGGAQNGIVFGRANSWKSRDFIVDYNSGADPMKQITSQVAKYWQKRRQSVLLTILDAVFGVSAEGWNDHKTNIAVAAGSTPTSDNKLGASSISDAAVDAIGDASDNISLAIMHSRVAGNLANLQLLDYWKYTDPQGIEKKLRLADYNGMTVVIDDGVPVSKSVKTAGVYELTISTAAVATDTFTILGKTYTWVANGTEETDTTIALPSTSTAANQASAIVTKLGTIPGYTATASSSKITFTQSTSAPDAEAITVSTTGTMKAAVVTATAPEYNKEYTTYGLGFGSILKGNASVKNPAEVGRNSLEDGGYDYLVTRLRETLHPNGFGFVKPESYTSSPTDEMLGNSSNWRIKTNHKNIYMVKIVSNG